MGFPTKPKIKENIIMSQEFVPDDNLSVSEVLEEDRPNSDSAISEQDVVCATVTGSPNGVRETILTL